ncbi:MAG: prepilin-type N-terminal cleavage/methylation domain-containing protein [Parasphingorhabdus sp.]|uniref:prepilin-type N-terminal cleavage/methylation domain-containing protein n=1 Tax=Parasphingorhabdus sp. TaxID=2709688 RepID=UPI003298892F
MTQRSLQNGFTLVEVLVALVVTALLAAIVMDGAVSAKLRGQNQELQTRALFVAQSHIEALRDQPGEPSQRSGAENGMIWALTEQEIARDPRGIFVIVEASIAAGTEGKPRLVQLQKRYLKKAQR